MIRRPPRSTPLYSSAASDVYKRQRAGSAARPAPAPGGRGGDRGAARAGGGPPAGRRRGQPGAGRDRDRPRPMGAGADRCRVHGLRGDPLQAARYRDRHGVSGAKSDAGDAHVLAELVRLDRAHHRPVAGDSAIAEHVKVLARAHQSLVWSRQRQTNMLRSMLREFYPGALDAFAGELDGRDALAVLAIAPRAADGRRLSRARVETALRRAGRQRYVATRAAEIVAALRADQLPARDGVEGAYGASVRALVAVISELRHQTLALAGAVEAGFGRHPDVEIYLSQPGLGPVLGARVLAEFGDDPARYADAKARRNYAGTSPITRASGKSSAVLARHVRNRRLADALDQQAF